MNPNDSTELEFSEESTEEYLHFALGAYHGGFSKGTANVDQNDIKKLHGLLDYYAKKKHPFTACVRDNRKRFGPKTEAYCAVLKDLIEGNTKWRNGGSKSSKGVKMSDEVLNEIFSIDIPEDFSAYLSEIDINSIMEQEKLGTVKLASGDVTWSLMNSFSEVKDAIEEDLNGPSDSGYQTGYAEDSAYPRQYYVKDINFVDSTALCCVGGSDHYVVPFTLNKKDGTVEVSNEQEWTAVTNGYVDLSEDMVAEMFFADEEVTKEEDGLIWKTVLREGRWSYSPGQGQKPVAKPITVVPSGASDHKTLTVSMEELKNNFDQGAVEHVTVPTSHEDKVTENTGFVRKMRFGKDDNGLAVLQAGIDFTEPEVKEKALRGTIANTSAGIVFDHVNKETGKKFGSAILHTALTNHPWLNGMKPFGVEASENLQVVAFSEDTTAAESGGGDKVPTTIEDNKNEETKTDTFEERLGLSEDAVRQIIAEHETQREEIRKNRIEAQVVQWEADKKSPAMITAAKAMLSQASSEQPVLKLSEEGKEVSLSAEDIINRLMDSAPQVLLADDVINDKDVSKDKPEDDTAKENLSQEQKVLATSLFFEEGLSWNEAVETASKRLAVETQAS